MNKKIFLLFFSFALLAVFHYPVAFSAGNINLSHAKVSIEAKGNSGYNFTECDFRFAYSIEQCTRIVNVPVKDNYNVPKFQSTDLPITDYRLPNTDYRYADYQSIPIYIIFHRLLI